MRSVLLTTAALSVIATSAFADETLKWRHVQHASSFQTQEVGELKGHAMAVYRLPGIAFFPDGTTGSNVVVGASDTVDGVGSKVIRALLSPMVRSFGSNLPDQPSLKVLETSDGAPTLWSTVKADFKEHKVRGLLKEMERGLGLN